MGSGGVATAWQGACGWLVVAGLALAASGQAAPSYRLEVLPGASGAINDRNEVTLVRTTSSGRKSGGVYNIDTGSYRALAAGLAELELTDISDTGWVTGYVRAWTGTRQIVAWNEVGRRATIRGASGGIITGPFVNDAGTVVWGDGSGWVWTPGKRAVTSAGAATMARTMRDLTDTGVIVGMAGGRATIAPAAGAAQDVPGTDGATWSEAIDANEAGQVLVSLAGTEGVRQIVWDPGTGVTRALVDPGRGRVMSMSRAMNNVGQVVGVGMVPGATMPEPMLWSGSTGYALRELLGGSVPAGWTGLLLPVDVNDRGVILGVGTFQGATTWFVLKPN